MTNGNDKTRVDYLRDIRVFLVRIDIAINLCNECVGDYEPQLTAMLDLQEELSIELADIELRCRNAVASTPFPPSHYAY